MGTGAGGPFAAAARLGLILRAPGVRRTLWVALFAAVVAGLFASVSLPSQVNLRAGEVAPSTILAPRDLVDRQATAAARQNAALKVPPVYTVDSLIERQAETSFAADVQAIDSARSAVAGTRPAAGPGAAGSSGSASAPSASASGAGATAASASSAAGGTPETLASAASALGATLGLSLPAADFEALLQASAGDVQTVAQAATQRLAAALAVGVLDDQTDLSAARQALESEIEALPAPAAVDRVLAALAGQSLVPDQFIDDQATAAAQQAAEAAVAPVTVAKGEAIVRQYDVVTADEIGLLQDAGLLHVGGTFGLVAGSALVALLLLGLCGAFLLQFQPQVVRDIPRLVLFGSLLTAALAGLRFALPVSSYLAPVAWAAMLAAVAFGPGVALFVGGLGGLAAGLMVHDLALGAVAVTGAWTAVFSLRRLVQRTDLLRAGLYAAAAQAAAALLLVGLVLGQSGAASGSLIPVAAAQPMIRDAAWAAFGGLLSGALAIGALPCAEALGILTPFKLLELANPSRPLLRRLMVEAPGTYHHTLMVANLAEAACEAIGGDSLLVRAGAYYHDIGKMKRPVFFIENQLGGSNPHDKLSPQLSALVITSHVRDGVEMARQARLPEEIVDFIRTHHGTTLVQYFYHAARRELAERSEGRLAASGGGARAADRPAGAAAPLAAMAGTVSEADFRYDGPLPGTRETAVVMLADGVEAAVRALPHPTAEGITALIQRIVSDRLEDGQLDRAALTLHDLHVISQKFRDILVGAYHARVEYPEALAGEVAPPGPRRLDLRFPMAPPPGRAR